MVPHKNSFPRTRETNKEIRIVTSGAGQSLDRVDTNSVTLMKTLLCAFLNWSYFKVAIVFKYFCIIQSSNVIVFHIHYTRTSTSTLHTYNTPQTHKHTNTQTHKHTNTQHTQTHTNTHTHTHTLHYWSVASIFQLGDIEPFQQPNWCYSSFKLQFDVFNNKVVIAANIRPSSKTYIL